MKKELVKVGMKVKLIGDKKAVDGLNSYVYEVIGNTEGDLYSLSRNGNNGRKEYLYAINCADFEQYEEPITERIDGWFIPQGNPLAPPSAKFPKEETSTYQAKDLEGNVIEEKVVEDNNVFNHEKIYQQIKELSPITQEFIESFGYKLIGYGSRDTLYDYLYRSENHRLSIKGNSFTLSISEDAQHNNCGITFICTTQSELIFLLTKGRIDCSK